MRSQLICSSILALALAVVLVLSVSGGATAGTGGGQPDFAAVDRYIRAEMDELKIPGLEAVVVHRDQVVYAEGFGVADPTGRAVTAETPMILGSVSKGITALAVMQLVEAGKVELDAPVQTYLPWFRLADGAAKARGKAPETIAAGAWERITVRQLLVQTSGITEFTGAKTWDSREDGEGALEEQVRSFAGFKMRRMPGSGFEYSNANYEVLGAIVQAVSGEMFDAYLQMHIFEPLEMRNSYGRASQAPDLATGYRFWFGQPAAADCVPAPRAHAPAAFIASCAADMGHYLIALMNEGKYRETQILPAARVEELQRPGAEMGGGYRYALGWVVGPDGALSHNGETATFTSGIRIEGDWGVFVVRNISANQRQERLNEIAPGILSIVRGQAPVQNKTSTAFRRIMVGLAAVLVMQVGGIAWSVRRWGRAARRPVLTAAGLLVGLLASQALAGVLWYLGPVANSRTFSVLAMAAPDQMLLLGSNVALAGVSAAVQVGRLWRLGVGSRRPAAGAR